MGFVNQDIFGLFSDEPMDGEALNTDNRNVTWRQGRQLLRQ